MNHRLIGPTCLEKVRPCPAHLSISRAQRRRGRPCCSRASSIGGESMLAWSIVILWAIYKINQIKILTEFKGTTLTAEISYLKQAQRQTIRCLQTFLLLLYQQLCSLTRWARPQNIQNIRKVGEIAKQIVNKKKFNTILIQLRINWHFNRMQLLPPIWEISVWMPK